MNINPGNIYSGDKARAVFTNPTEIAFRKGNLKNHYPVVFRGVRYKDAEEAYQKVKRSGGWLTWDDREALCTEIITAKLAQYPQIVAAIENSGGEEWIKKCSHFVGGKMYATTPWEGNGIESVFIRCLLQAYVNVIAMR